MFGTICILNHSSNNISSGIVFKFYHQGVLIPSAVGNEVWPKYHSTPDSCVFFHVGNIFSGGLCEPDW